MLANWFWYVLGVLIIVTVIVAILFIRSRGKAKTRRRMPEEPEREESVRYPAGMKRYDLYVSLDGQKATTLADMLKDVGITFQSITDTLGFHYIFECEEEINVLSLKRNAYIRGFTIAPCGVEKESLILGGKEMSKRRKKRSEVMPLAEEAQDVNNEISDKERRAIYKMLDKEMTPEQIGDFLEIGIDIIEKVEEERERKELESVTEIEGEAVIVVIGFDEVMPSDVGDVEEFKKMVRYKYQDVFQLLKGKNPKLNIVEHGEE